LHSLEEEVWGGLAKTWTNCVYYTRCAVAVMQLGSLLGRQRRRQSKSLEVIFS
jgi:hypothetical protein